MFEISSVRWVAASFQLGVIHVLVLHMKPTINTTPQFAADVGH